MRRLLGVSALVLSLGCATPHSSGGLWALDEARLEEELVYRTPEPQRAAQARDYQLRVADEALAADQSRLEQLLATCPEPRQDRLAVSPAAQARDGVRARQDAERAAQVARLAAADWYLRRAATTGQTSFCDRARLALIQSLPGAAGLGLPEGVVQRDTTTDADPLDASADPYQALAAYALGLVDAVRGPAPLVGHLMAAYGGSLELTGSVPGSPEETVDRVAPGLTWEPDGLYATLRAAR
jgi:hypothetical protein